MLERGRCCLRSFKNNTMNEIMSQEEVFNRFGQPGNWKDFVRFYPPFEMVIAWDTSTKIDNFFVHKALKPRLEQIYFELEQCYSASGIEELGLNMFGGCYNYRKMRGGSKWSRHSWAIAIDLDPSRNKLRWKRGHDSTPEPYFASEIWETEIHPIFEKNGLVNYGRVKNYDWMHFEIAK